MPQKTGGQTAETTLQWPSRWRASESCACRLARGAAGASRNSRQGRVCRALEPIPPLPIHQHTSAYVCRGYMSIRQHTCVEASKPCHEGGRASVLHPHRVLSKYTYIMYMCPQYMCVVGRCACKLEASKASRGESTNACLEEREPKRV